MATAWLLPVAAPLLTLKDTSNLLQAVLVTHVLSSSLHVYVVGSVRSVDTSSFVSNPEPHVEIVTSVSMVAV